ncbi:MAG: type transport system permease protein [Bacteroidetes bacterium]|nr:type transport system permease protein [Bacteroidota bacterium]
MSKALAVARWEYLEKVKSKAFLIGLLLTPILMITMTVLPGIFASQEDEESRVVGVIDATGKLIAPFAERFQTRYILDSGVPNYVVMPLAVGPNVDLDAARRDAIDRVSRDEIAGFFVLTGSDTVVEYHSKTVGDFRIAYRIEETIKELVAQERVRTLGLDPGILKQLEVHLDVRTVKLSAEGEKEDARFETVYISAIIFQMMLFLLIITSGQMLVRSVIEEKSNRIVEVLVSSCSPTELMAGKVLGLSALGFTQMAFWAVIGVAISARFDVTFVALDQGLLLLLYFILGYLFYAAVFIGAGSPFNTEQEAQQITSYLVIFLVLPIAVALPAVQNPGALWIQILSYVPLLTPTMMALRIPIQMPSWWEILSTVLVMLVSIYGAMIVAGRIFRIGILSTGKSPSLKEFFRWIRTG